MRKSENVWIRFGGQTTLDAFLTVLFMMEAGDGMTVEYEHHSFGVRGDHVSWGIDVKVKGKPGPAVIEHLRRMVPIPEIAIDRLGKTFTIEEWCSMA